MKKTKTLDFGRGISRVVITLATAGVLVLASSCATTRPTEQQVDDSKVTASLAAKYNFDTEIERDRININTINGIVTLRGKVADAEQRGEAERIAWSSDGVLSVVNELELDPTRRTAQVTFDDSMIRIMIDAKLMADPEVRSRNVDIHVYEGVVTLSGIVETPIARDEAEDLTKSVDGVVKVINEIEVGEKMR